MYDILLTVYFQICLHQVPLLADDHLRFVGLNKVGKMYTSVSVFKFFGCEAANVSAL